MIEEENLDQSLRKHPKSIITLNCLIKDHTTMNTFPIHVNGSELVGDCDELKERNALYAGY